MSYRDELDAAKAHIAQLEEEKERLGQRSEPQRFRSFWFYTGACMAAAVAAIITLSMYVLADSCERRSADAPPTVTIVPTAFVGPGAAAPTRVVEQPTRPDEAWLRSRLASCQSGGTEAYPYAEGVVFRIERVLHTRRRGWGFAWAPIVSIRATVLVPGRGEVVFDHRDFYDSGPGDPRTYEALFWQDVQVGDIIGITWHVDAGRETVFAVRTTDK